MYIVTSNRPYYPDVEYFNTLEEATAARDQFVKENNEPDGRHFVKVTIAKVIETVEVRTDY